MAQPPASHSPCPGATSQRDRGAPLRNWSGKYKCISLGQGRAGGLLFDTLQSFLRKAGEQTCLAVMTDLKSLYLSSLVQQQKNV